MAVTKKGKDVSKEKLAEAEKEDVKKEMPQEEEEKCSKAEAEPEMEKEAFEGKETEEEESEEEKKKKKAEKGALGGENPEELVQESQTAGNTISPGAGTPSQSQHVLVPQSQISVSREQHTPMDGMHKSANPDLLKSPLFLNITKQMEALQDAMTSKMEAMEKSISDRLANMKKELATTEEGLKKFYEQSFHKALGENVAPEATQQVTISKQLEDGKVRFRN